MISNRFLPDINKSLTLLMFFGLAFSVEKVATHNLAFTTNKAQSAAFSAANTKETIARLLPENRPHPVGSKLNKLLANRIVAEFSAIGINAQMQTRFQCKNAVRASAIGCAQISNIIITLPGNNVALEDYVVVSAHYDSQAGTPGIADDLAGVATIIELARHFKANPIDHKLLFLITDSEETGLLGAEAFTKHHALADKIGFIINLEAAGTRGPVTLFETSAPNGLPVSLFADSVSRPVGSSTLHEIYKILPNTTDLAVHFDVGSVGLNLAFFEHKQHYHTPLDTLENLSIESLQHQGNNGLELIPGVSKALLNSDAQQQSLLYVDVLQRFLITLEKQHGVSLALGLFMLALLLSLNNHRSLKNYLSVLYFPTILILTLMLCSFLQIVFTSISGISKYWYSQPYASLFLYLIAIIFLVSWWSNWFLKYVSMQQIYGTAGAWLLLLSAISGLTQPLFMMELLITGIAFLGASFATRFTKTRPLLICAILFAIPTMIWLSLLNLILPIGALRAAALPGLIMLIIVLPFAGFRFGKDSWPYGKITLIAVLLVGLLWWQQTIGYQANSPQHVSLEYVEDVTLKSRTAYWLISDTKDPIPQPLQDTLDFSAKRVAKLPIGDKIAFWADAEFQNLPKTRLMITADEAFGQLRTISFQLHPSPDSYITSLYIPAEYHPLSMVINEQEFHFEPDRLYHGHHAFICYTDACAAQQYTLVFDTSDATQRDTMDSIDVLMSAQTLGLGKFADVASLRPLIAQPYNRGDTSTIWWQQTIAVNSPESPKQK